jgi:hypothetical protein
MLNKGFVSVTKITCIVAVCVLVFTLVNSSLVLATEFIVDDVDAAFVGYWNLSTGVSGYYGSGYRINSAGDGSDSATWIVNVPTEGSWEVFARWTSYRTRGTDVPYTVGHKYGSTVVRVNQQVLGGVWFSLGVYSFDVGAASVMLSDDADGSVCADAIKIVEVSVPPAEPLEVILDEPIEVTLDEPIEITNPPSESLDVAIPDGVEVTNFDEMPDVNLDVSGWLHTTKSGDAHMANTLPSYMSLDLFETKGYRLLAVRFVAGSSSDCTFLLRWTAGSYVMYEETFTVMAGNEEYHTYDVIGELLSIQVKSPDSTDAYSYYYLTT